MIFVYSQLSERNKRDHYCMHSSFPVRTRSIFISSPHNPILPPTSWNSLRHDRPCDPLRPAVFHVHISAITKGAAYAAFAFTKAKEGIAACFPTFFRVRLFRICISSSSTSQVFRIINHKNGDQQVRDSVYAQQVVDCFLA